MALYTRNVLLSLGGGIILGVLLLNNFNLYNATTHLYTLFTSLLNEGWILKTLGFAILVGSVMALMEKSGGIEAFVEYVEVKSTLVSSPRGALMLSYFIGVVIFIESSITSLIAGAVGKPLCDKYKIPHAKLAFVCDSTSAPVSSLLVFNGWGALLLGLITTQVDEGLLYGDSISILIDAVMYNFYAMSALLVTFVAVWFKVDIGAMAQCKFKPSNYNARAREKTKVFYMLVPVISIVFLVFLFLYLTGDGNILQGSGSSAIFYTMLVTLGLMFMLYVPSATLSVKSYMQTSYRGAKTLFPIAMILLFAFAIGKVTTEMQTGLYLASLANENLSVYFLAGVIFLLSSLIAFSTGTSWGTFSIMIPVAVPMAVAMDANVALVLGAVISGGIFGDHCSPISDTTIISSMASDCEVIEHVRTQLPYALISGVIAFFMFVVFSFLSNG